MAGPARVAVQFVLNYEEGGENCVLHGDAASEQFLSEMFNPASLPRAPHEHGGHLRIRLACRRVAHPARVRAPRLPLTCLACPMALQRHPELTAAFTELGHEIACHGLKWIHYQGVPEEVERAHMARPWRSSRVMTGSRPVWAGTTGRDSPQHPRLVADHGGFAYDSDYYGDDLPFWMKVRQTDGAWCPAHRALHAGRERHALSPAPRAFARRPVLPVPEGTPSTRCMPKATRLATTRPR